MTREEAIKVLRVSILSTNEQLHEAVFMAIKALKAEPIKHGHWIEEGLVDGNQNRYCRCSECGKGDTQAISQRVPYCWWCGAIMDNAPTEKVDTPTESTNRLTDEAEDE